jgi:hypothetical protein
MKIYKSTYLASTLYLLRKLSNTHLFYLNGSAILSLSNSIGNEDSLAVVEFIAETDDRGMPYPVNLTADEGRRKTASEASGEIVDVKKDPFAFVLCHCGLLGRLVDTSTVG